MLQHEYFLISGVYQQAISHILHTPHLITQSSAASLQRTQKLLWSSHFPSREIPLLRTIVGRSLHNSRAMSQARRPPKRFAPLDPEKGNASRAPPLKGIVFDVDGTLWYVGLVFLRCATILLSHMFHTYGVWQLIWRASERIARQSFNRAELST